MDMATLTEPMAASTSAGKLRPFDPFHDLGPMTDLVELCFADTLDPEGRSYLQRLRDAAHQPVLLRWAATSAEWAGGPMGGYVWVEDGRLVGNVSLIANYMQGKRYYLIANVAVHPDFRRRGIARLLTQRAVEHARQRGSPSVWLHVREENAPAITLYQYLGFIEHARRTSWQSSPVYTVGKPPDEVRFAPLKSRDWPVCRGWLAQNYPVELLWYIPFNLNIFRPGLAGEFFRFFYNTVVRSWGAYQKDRLAAALFLQPTQRHANILWLAAPPEVNSDLVKALLTAARQEMLPARSLMLDYPARQKEQAIWDAGFYAQQTLVWMELPLS